MMNLACSRILNPVWKVQIPKMSIQSQGVAGHISTKIDQVLEDCEEAIGISDICVYGRTTAEHDRNLRKTMDTVRRYGLVFNKDEYKIRLEQIKFYGLGTKTVPALIQKNVTGLSQNLNQQTEV